MPSFSSASLARADSVSGKVGQHPRAGLHQDDPGAAGSKRRKSRSSALAGELGDRTGELDSGRAGADDDEGQQRRALGIVGTGLGQLEGDQDAAADRRRVIDLLEARRGPFPLVLAEVIVARTGGEDEIVVWHPAVVEQHGLGRRSMPVTRP